MDLRKLVQVFTIIKHFSGIAVDALLIVILLGAYKMFFAPVPGCP